MVVETAPAANPLAIGQVVARNIVPVVGVLAFGWPAFNVLLLYFVDTMLALGVMFAGLFAYFTRGTAEAGVASRLNGAVGAIGGGAFLTAFIAVPLGMPLVFVGAASGPSSWSALLEDRGLLAGIAWQVVAAIWSYWGLWQALQHQSPDELRLKRRFALVFLRWIVIVGAVYTPLTWLLGRFMAHALVVLYVAASIVVEIAPDRFLRIMPGGAVDTAPPKHASRTRKKP